MRLHPERSRRGALEADATLIGGAGENRRAVLIEYERSERPRRLKDRLRRYDAWLLDGWRSTHFATHATAPTVIFLTAREESVQRLIEPADEVLSAWYGHQHAGPREGVRPARERILFTSRERILAGDWTMLRAPSLPSGLREHERLRKPHSLVYDLPAALRGAQPRASDQRRPARQRWLPTDVGEAALYLEEAAPSQGGDTLG